MGQHRFKDALRRLAFQRSLRQRPCAHVTELRDAPRSALVCPNCERDGSTWVHLRMCLTCGAVGCCDSSAPKHARNHYAETGHPVIRSIERDEQWAWCYVDRAYVTPRLPSAAQ
jgi:uncharacterized UBP type Zn finger protein